VLGDLLLAPRGLRLQFRGVRRSPRNIGDLGVT
jgi:hypothetical protein